MRTRTATSGPTLDVEITVHRGTGTRASRVRTPTVDKPEPARIPRIARLMALAIKLQDMIDRGEVRDYADLARLGFVSRARLTQIMNLLLLAPDLQEKLLWMSVSSKGRNLCEQRIRKVAALVSWEEQRTTFNSNLGK